jgi:hypothetical protein
MSSGVETSLTFKVIHETIRRSLSFFADCDKLRAMADDRW